MALESLPLQPGNWQSLNDYLAEIAGGNLSAVKYGLASNGATVTAYDQTGKSVASVPVNP